MAISWSLFSRELENTFKSNQSEKFSDFSDKFSSIYSRSTLNLATTSTGQLLIGGNYTLIKNSMNSFLNFNRDIDRNIRKIETSLESIKTVLNSAQNSAQLSAIELPPNTHPILRQVVVPYIKNINSVLESANKNNESTADALKNEITSFEDFISELNFEMVPYIFLETAFISFWATVKFSPTPPIPPTVAPLFGITVLSPGIPGILSAGFKLGFSSKDSSKAATIITNSLQAHAKTISGTYSGLIPSPTGTVPSPPIPWIGVV